MAITLAPSVSHAASQPQGLAQVMKLNAIKASHLAGLRSEVLKNGNSSPKNLQAGPATSWLKRVNPDEVNMVTNRLEKKRQDAIKIDGKTYYGNGEGYASALLKNRSLTRATDPYNGKKIDKSEAHIFVDASGGAHYFESAETYSAFVSLASGKEVSVSK
jgi:YHS domain-containing protein